MCKDCNTNTDIICGFDEAWRGKVIRMIKEGRLLYTPEY